MDVRDFDFLAGDWIVENRRLTARLAGSDDWDVFPGTARCRPYLGGMANVDQIDFPTRGWSGMTVRSFDLARRMWSLVWISSRAGAFTPPVVGGFDGERGTFRGEDVDEGRLVRVRYVWERLGANAARWEQAFSLDGDAWETNWTMALTRV